MSSVAQRELCGGRERPAEAGCPFLDRPADPVLVKFVECLDELVQLGILVATPERRAIPMDPTVDGLAACADPCRKRSGRNPERVQVLT